MGEILKIKGKNGEDYIQLPEKDYLALIEQLEDLADVAAYDEAKRKLESGQDVLIPFN